MNVDEVDKLKVADLKKELKSRNLSVSGIKSDLVQRLSDHIKSTENHILGSANDLPDDSLDAAEADILGISPQEKVLDPVTKPISPKKTTPITPKQPITAVTMKTVHLKSPEVTETEAKKLAISTLSDEEKRLERAKKYNTTGNVEDKKLLRAERFGLPAPATSNKLSIAGVAKDPETLKKRAERFGVPDPGTAVTEDEKKLLRAAKFNSATAAITVGSVKLVGKDEEMLRKRKDRFGDADSDSKPEGGLVGGDAKKKRAERFGVKA